MSERGKQLYTTADQQITELLEVIAALDPVSLRKPLPGREKLGDGTVYAAMRHTADNYERVAAFVSMAEPRFAQRGHSRQRPRHADRLFAGVGHKRPEQAEPAEHGKFYTADDAPLDTVIGQLSASRDALRRITELTDSELDAIPPAGSFRFCDGQRTLESVLASLLKHLRHQIDALASALA
jgi:hypothetical protein